MKHSPNVTKFGLWARAGMVSAGVVLVAIVQVLEGEGSTALTVGVAVLAAIALVTSLTRARSLLSTFDGAPMANIGKASSARSLEPAISRIRELPKNFRVPMPERP